MKQISPWFFDQDESGKGEKYLKKSNIEKEFDKY